MAVSSSAAIMIEGEVGKGVSAYSLVGALRAMLGKPANREADSKAFNNLKETRPLLQNLPTVTISRRSGTRLSETPALSTMQQVDAVIDSMSYTSIAAGFRAQYIGAIISMLPSSGVPAPQNQPLPAYLDVLEGVTRAAGADRFSGTARGYHALKALLSGVQAADGVHFNATHREQQAGFLVLQYKCHFGGKPKWEERKARATQQPGDFRRAASAGHSIKVGCPALITARIPLNYARSLGLVAWPEGMQPPPVMDKSIPITMVMEHCGHHPNTPMDLNSLPLDAR